MYIDREGKQVINHKRISRIKSKYGLVTKRRKKTRLSAGMREMLENNVCKNLLKQSFTTQVPKSVYSTDVTYLTNRKGQRAYFSGVKDLCSKEIIGYSVSDKNDTELVLESLKSLLNLNCKGSIIHSDQGHQYLSHLYQNTLKVNGIKQSMSRRGNCYDNAPIESFFGHLKDECEYQDWKTIEDLKSRIAKYIKFYNEGRPQWGLNRKTPVEYRSSLS